MEIEYDEAGQTARFTDDTGDVVELGASNGTVILDCENESHESTCAVLDRPRVEALRGLLTRWLETGNLRPEALPEFGRDLHDNWCDAPKCLGPCNCHLKNTALRTASEEPPCSQPT